MNRAEFIKTAYIIKPVKLPRSPGSVSGCSGACSTLGAHKALVRFIGDHTTVKKRVRIKHASASTTLIGSATNFATAIDVSATGVSGQFAWDIDLTGCKGYLIVAVSTITTSSNYICFADLFYNRNEPIAAGTTAATGNLGTVGFAAFTHVTVN